jgi:hypothetical protein
MIADVREHLERIPFVSFSIRTSDGHEYPVPSRDHAHISPRDVIFLNAGPAVLLGPIHINSTVDQQSKGE